MNFVKFDKKSCIKNNLITLSIFIITFLFVMICACISTLLGDCLKIGAVCFMALVLIALIYLSIIFMVIAPLFIRIYEKFTDNLKSLISLWIFNLILILHESQPTKNLRFFVTFLLFTTLGSLLTLTLKYFFIMNKQFKHKV